jgi:hypothetical protein
MSSPTSDLDADTDPDSDVDSGAPTPKEYADSPPVRRL